MLRNSFRHIFLFNGLLFFIIFIDLGGPAVTSTRNQTTHILSRMLGISPNLLWDDEHSDLRFLSLLALSSKYPQRESRKPRASSSFSPKRSTCRSNTFQNGTCVEIRKLETQCWDKDIVESDSCTSYAEKCCVDRNVQTVDEGPCGTTGLSIRNPRRLRPVPDAITKEICWMVSLIAVTKSGEHVPICDAVILNSTAVMTPSECAVRMNEVKQLKKVVVQIARNEFSTRRAQDFSKQPCGQEFQVEKFWPLSDSFLKAIATKGFAVLNIHGSIQKDSCTCRVCLPTQDDFRELSPSSRCYISGSISNAPGKQKIGERFEIAAFRTNILHSAACMNLLSPQNLPQKQIEIIREKLLCSISPQISGLCKGQLGGSLTCVLGEDERQALVGLSIQPLDCYSAPRLFRNIVGCYDSWNNSLVTCKSPDLPIAPQTCGRLKNNMTDPFKLSFQTHNGSSLRHRNIGRRMQMLSSFPVSDVVLMGRSGFSSSEMSEPGLHIMRERSVCWEVAVHSPEKGHCSGVLIDAKFVLTAAHCLTTADGKPLDDLSSLRVFIGFDSVPREKYRDCEEIRGVKSFIVHPLYSKPSGNRFYDINDLTLVELELPVDFENNPCACQICLDLPDRNKPVAGEICTLSGYGCPSPILASETCPAPRPWPLTWSNLILLSDNVCSAIPDLPSNAMACTIADGGPSACYGDSGGPLVCYSKEDEHHYLHAIFSFILSTSASGPQRCRSEPLNPNFYTKIVNYLPWLIENIPGLQINA